MTFPILDSWSWTKPHHMSRTSETGAKITQYGGFGFNQSANPWSSETNVLPNLSSWTIPFHVSFIWMSISLGSCSSVFAPWSVGQFQVPGPLPPRMAQMCRHCQAAPLTPQPKNHPTVTLNSECPRAFFYPGLGRAEVLGDDNPRSRPELMGWA